MENHNAELNESQFQSETGRKIQTFLVNSASSPLFYTVSGNQGQEKVFGSKKYYVEQLGCPSIIKPSFRDLPGCTRLSVGVPSPSYRQFPLDKLNKTIMGKSPPTTTTTSSFGKRFTLNRGEKFMSPIKVNAKIRHIYSHITNTSESSTLSHQSSTHSISTHTQTDQFTDVRIQSVDEETSIDDDLRKDAFTCTSPPPHPLQIMSDTPLSHSIPPAYAGKLEDLEKITGHIVIQRFFTRADEAFGMWLEKQLGMNVKSVGVGGDNDTIDSSARPLHPNLEKYDTCAIEIGSANKKQRESRMLEKIIEVDDILNGEEVVPATSTIIGLESELETFEKICGLDDNVKCECFWDMFNQTEESCQVDHVQDLTNIEQEIISQCIQVEIINCTKSNGEQLLETDSRLEHQVGTEEIHKSPIMPNISIENDVSSSIYDRPCIPDIIDVSQFYSNQTIPQFEEATETNEDSEELKTIISNPSMTEIQLESQYKVVEYLGKLEISSPVNDASSSANSINSEIGGVIEESSNGYKVNVMHMEDGDVTSDAIKRSISVDSCIGTESSGERNMLNDSGILLDSGRMDIDIPEEGEFVTSEVEDMQSLPLTRADIKSQAEDFEPEISVLHHDIPLLSNKSQSIDDGTNYSRSDASSALKHISDEGGDADQSESNSDSEFSSLRKPLQDDAGVDDFPTMDDTELDDPNALLVDEDDGEESEQDQYDQFDTIIENHEKEKRLRPIYRKRHVSTQTSKSVASSTVSCTTDSRSTTATSESSFDLEFISKSKKYISHSHIPSKGGGDNAPTNDVAVGRKRSYLPTGSSGLNILNMKFTMGKEFESEVSIRLPPKSPTSSISSSTSFNYQTLPNAVTTTTSKQSKSNKSNSQSQTQAQSQLPAIQRGLTHSQEGPSTSTTLKLAPLLQQDPELKSLWKDVKYKMDSRVETETETTDFLQITGSRIRLLSSSAETTTTRGNACNTLPRPSPSGPSGDDQVEEGTKLPVLISNNEQEKLKRSLKRLRKLLDD